MSRISLKRFLKFIPLILAWAPSGLWAEAAGITNATGVDVLWVTVATALVFFMQAGFLMLETGLVRSKNTINVAVKNLLDVCLGMVTFFFLGYALMFGESAGGWIGTNLFALEGLSADPAREYLYFLFQAAFMATAATIVSGAVAERIRFGAYVIVALIITTFIYPVFGHWAWGNGWLQAMGFKDFAGSTVVHSVGGWVALAGVIVLGPRRHKFQDGKTNDLYGHDLPASVLGAFILWFGWFGFNGGSLLGPGKELPLILLTTCLAAGAGAVAAMLISIPTYGRVRVEDGINGLLGGLVAITAGCDAVSPLGSVVIGLIAGVVAVLVVVVLERVLRIDDVVGAFAVHGACGVWGTLATALFAVSIPENFQGSRSAFFGVQALGVAVCAAWSFGLGLLIFLFLKPTGLLRVSAEAEDQGLNVSEHGARTTWIDLMYAMDEIARGAGNLGRRIAAEPGTHVGAIAEIFNRIQANLADIIRDVRGGAREMDSASERLSDAARDIAAGVEEQSAGMEEIASITTAYRDSFNSIIKNREQNFKQIETIRELSDVLYKGFHDLAENVTFSRDQAGLARRHAGDGRRDLDGMVDGMNNISSSSDRVSELVDILQEISDRLGLLSLNASIEAARSGEHGRGFAVVAEEISRLSESTNVNTQEARRYLEEVRESVSQGNQSLTKTVNEFQAIATSVDELDNRLFRVSESADRFNKNLDTILSAVKQVFDSSGEIMDAVRRRSSEFAELADSIDHVNQGLADLTERAEIINEAGSGLYTRSRGLRQLTEGFQLDGEAAPA